MDRAKQGVENYYMEKLNYLDINNDSINRHKSMLISTIKRVDLQGHGSVNRTPVQYQYWFRTLP